MDPQVINQLIILFLLMVLGFVATKIGFIDKVGSDKISSLISRVTMPAMYLSTFMGQQFSRESLAQSGILLVISVVFYAFSLAFSFLFVFLTRTEKREGGVYQFLLVFSNAAYMGFPVLRAVLGEEAIFYGAFFNIPFNILAYSLGIWLLHRGRGKGSVRPKDMFLNPGTLAVAAGVLFFVLSPLWNETAVYRVFARGPVFQTLDMVGGMTVPLSMLVIGCVLATVKPGAVFKNWRIMLTCLARLIIIPGAVYLCLLPFELDPIVRGIPVLIAGMPAAVFSVILSKEYGGDEKTASVGVFLSTLASALTIPLISSWL